MKALEKTCPLPVRCCKGMRHCQPAVWAVARVKGSGGPGERAGIHPGDVVLAISGTPATTFANGQLLATASVGDPVELTVLRNGAKASVWLNLEESPGPR